MLDWREWLEWLSFWFVAFSPWSSIALVALVLLALISRRRNKRRSGRRRAVRRKYARRGRFRKSAKRHLAKIIAMKASGASDQAILNYVADIHHFSFEELVLLAATKHYKCRNRTPVGYTGDGGIDGILKRRMTTYLMQAKRYSRSARISRNMLEQFATICETKNSTGLFFHTAKEWPDLHVGSVKVVQGRSLVQYMLGDYDCF